MRNALINDGMRWPVKYLGVTLLVESNYVEVGSKITPWGEHCYFSEESSDVEDGLTVTEDS